MESGLPWELDEGGVRSMAPRTTLKLRMPWAGKWQMTTIQFDFNLPERFDMTFVDKDGQQAALHGSPGPPGFSGTVLRRHDRALWRAFPVWIAPEQVAVIPVGETFNDYARR
jgi:threonyl-tRNA synthetase